MLDEAVSQTVRRYLQQVEESGIPVRFGVVFGSKTEGSAGPWSDIDLLVVSPAFDGLRDRGPIDLLWRLSARVDSRIEPVPCGEAQWETDDVSSLMAGG